MLDTFSYERSKELREQLLTKIFRLGPNVVQKWNWKYGYYGFRRHQSNRKLFTIDFDKMMNMMIIPWIILAFVLHKIFVQA